MTKAREIILKLLEVFVLKFKSIAKYQVAYLLEGNTSPAPKEGAILSLSDFSIKRSVSELAILQTSQHQSDEHKSKVEKLDAFLNNYEDKDKTKVCE